ncbi:MAG: hypothetical protein KF800_12250 [Lysobacter sp.]|nr:hypothetical protein [Lysobacter sp.]
MKHAWTLPAALLFATGTAYAEDIVWTASIAQDARTVIAIVDATETGCKAQVAQYANAVIVEACQPTAASRAASAGIGTGDTSLSPIQDDGTGGRGSGRTTIRPRP